MSDNLCVFADGGCYCPPSWDKNTTIEAGNCLIRYCISNQECNYVVRGSICMETGECHCAETNSIFIKSSKSCEIKENITFMLVVEIIAVIVGILVMIALLRWCLGYFMKRSTQQPRDSESVAVLSQRQPTGRSTPPIMMENIPLTPPPHYNSNPFMSQASADPFSTQESSFVTNFTPPPTFTTFSRSNN